MRAWNVITILLITVFQVTGTSIYFVGNSLTDGVDYNNFRTYCETNGESLIWGRHMIPGAPLDWNWDNPNACISQDPYGCYPTALGNYSWDAVSLQPFDRLLDSDVQAAGNFINLTRTKSPDVQIYLYGRWPNSSRGDFTAWFDKVYTGGWDGTNETRDYLEKLAAALTAANPLVKPILILPISEVMYELDKRMKAGQVPGFSNIFQVYTDGWHMSNVGSFICGATAYATLFGQSPEGKTVAGYSLDGAVAAAISRAVWDVVSTYTLSGVGNEVSILPAGAIRCARPRATGAGGRLYDMTGRSLKNHLSMPGGRGIRILGNGTVIPVVR